MSYKTIIKWIFNVGLSGMLIPIADYLLKLIPWNQFIDPSNYRWFTEPILHISILHILLFIVFFSIVICTASVIGRKIQKKNAKEADLAIKDMQELRLQQLRAFRSLRFEDNDSVEVRWEILEPSYDNSHYHSGRIEYYCLKHNPPQLMPHGHCNHPDCPNARFFSDKYKVQNQIDSMIIQKARDLGLEE